MAARPATRDYQILQEKKRWLVEALGKSQGSFSTKLHLRAEGKGKPMTFVLTAGQRHEATKLEALMEQGAVKRVGRGRPKFRYYSPT